MKNFIKASTLLLMTSALFYSCSTSEEPQEEVIPKFQLSVTSNEGGTVSSSGGSYEQGTLISITANPNQEYLFDKWTGSINSNSNPLEITLNKNETIEANFLKKQYELTINIMGNGAVDEELINNSKLYESGSKIKLTAVPEAGSYFEQWQIDDEIITENPIELDLAGPTEVTVSFIGENGIIDYNLFRGNSEEIGKVIEIYKEDKDYIMYGEFNYSDASGLYVPRNVKLVKEISKTENVETFYRLDDLKRPYEIFQKIEGQETEQIQQINYFPDSTVVTLNRIKEDGFLEIISKEVLPKTPFSSTNGENVKDRQLINFSSHGGCDDDLFQEECEGLSCFNPCEDGNIFDQMVDWLDDNSWTGTPGEMLSNLLTVNKEQSCNNNSDKDPISCEELSDPEDAQEEDLPSYFTFTVRNRSSTSFVTCGDSTNQCSSAGFSFAVKINDVTTSSIGPGQSTTVSLPYGQSYTWDLVGINLYGGARTFTVYPPNNKVVTLSQCCDVGGSSILSIDNTYYSNDRIVNDIFPFE